MEIYQYLCNALWKKLIWVERKKEAINNFRYKRCMAQFRKIEKPLTIYYAFLDIQGFYINGCFVPKELSISRDGIFVWTFLFEPPQKFNTLSDDDRKQTIWLERNYHGLKYSAGVTPLSNFNKIIKTLQPIHFLYVKGNQKFEYVKKHFPDINVIDLNLSVNLKKSKHNCVNHILKYSYCAEVNVYVLRNNFS